MMEEHLMKVEKGLLKKVVEEVLLKMVVVEGFLKMVGVEVLLKMVVEEDRLKKVVVEALLKKVVVEDFLKKVGDPLMMEVVVMTYLSLKNSGLIPYFDQMMVEEISNLIVSYCY